jgi:hypothetical protein
MKSHCSIKKPNVYKETGNPNLRLALDLGLTPRELFEESIFRAMKMLLFSPIVLSLHLELWLPLSGVHNYHRRLP